MIVSMHQPEHFPYLGYFQKMKNCDVFVMLDDVKYRKNYFQNRNRFINRSGDEEWFTVPVEKNCNSKNINEVMVSKDPHWRKKVIKQIKFNLKHDVEEVYKVSDRLIDINMSSIEWCRKKLGIDTPIVMSSKLGLPGDETKTDLLLSICENLKATEYVSGPSGKDYLDQEKFSARGIKLTFFQPDVTNHMSTIYNVR